MHNPFAAMDKQNVAHSRVIMQQPEKDTPVDFPSNCVQTAILRARSVEQHGTKYRHPAICTTFTAEGTSGVFRT